MAGTFPYVCSDTHPADSRTSPHFLPTVAANDEFMDHGLTLTAAPAARSSARPLVIRPLRDPSHAFDATEFLVEALAREIARRCGGNAVLNRLEAAAHLASLLEREAQSSVGLELEVASTGRGLEPHAGKPGQRTSVPG